MQRLSILALSTLLSLFAVPGGLAESKTPPVILYSPAPPTPESVRVQKVPPIVRVKVHVDETGRSEGVEVLGVEPSGENDEAYAKAAQEAIAEWRFKPASENGQPVKSTMSWSVQFHPVKAVIGWTAPESRDAVDAGRLSRAQLLAGSVEMRQRVKARVLETARKVLDPAALVSVKVETVTVMTDFGGEANARAIGHNILASWAATYSLFEKIIPAQPAIGQMHIIVFRDRKAYERFTKLHEGLDWTAGFYCPSGVIAFHSEHAVVEYLMSVLIHEAVHAIIDRHIARHGVVLPRWLGEGFAEYIAKSDIKRGRLIPGSKRKRYAGYRMDLRYGVLRLDSDAVGTVKRLKRAAREKKTLELTEIIRADRETFYSEKRHLYYPQSWVLVHFLCHGEEGWGKNEFPRFMLYVAEGYDVLEAFREVYGMELESLGKAYQKYLEKF